MKPSPLPAVFSPSEEAKGFVQGLAVGLITGMGFVVILASVVGK